MTAFSLLSDSRELVNRYFKVNAITLLFLAIAMIISIVVDQYTQPLEQHIIQQSSDILFGTAVNLNNPESFGLGLINQDIKQLSIKMTHIFSTPEIQHILLALLLISLGTIILASFMELGKISMGLEISGDKEQKSRKSFFSSRQKIWLYWGTTFLQTSAIILGMICFIIPGIYIACRLILTNYILVAENSSIFGALQKSRSITKGYTRLIFKTSILLGLTQLVGLLAMGIGLIWTYPMTWITWGKFYRTLVKQNHSKK